MRIHNVLTGDVVKYGTLLERQERRIARMRHIVWLAVHTMKDVQTVDGGRLIMFTLTYKGVKDWHPRHVSGLCRWLRGKGVICYAWVAELQQRGAVHYHLLALWPKGKRWVKPSKKTGGWVHGFTWVTVGVRWPWYILKYMQKGSKDGRAQCFPRGLRLYGISQGIVRRMCFDNALLYRECMLPGWYREGQGDDCDMRSSFRVNGGVALGRWIAVSPWITGGLDDIDTIVTSMYNKAGTNTHIG